MAASTSTSGANRSGSRRRAAGPVVDPRLHRPAPGPRPADRAEPEHRLRAGRVEAAVAGDRLRQAPRHLRSGEARRRHRPAADRPRLPDGGERGRRRLLQCPAVRALRRTAREAVAAVGGPARRRAEAGRGRGRRARARSSGAEVQLAESLRLLDAAEEGVGFADAAAEPGDRPEARRARRVVEPPGIPEFRPALGDCLETAIRSRREFQVARRSVEVAQQGDRVAGASFAPRVVAEGRCSTFSRPPRRVTPTSPSGSSGWNGRSSRGAGGSPPARGRLEGPRGDGAGRVDRRHDRLPGQRELSPAGRRPSGDRPCRARRWSRPARTYRLVRARAAEGDATPSEITDAQTALTRPERERISTRSTTTCRRSHAWNTSWGSPPRHTTRRPRPTHPIRRGPRL